MDSYREAKIYVYAVICACPKANPYALLYAPTEISAVIWACSRSVILKSQNGLFGYSEQLPPRLLNIKAVNGTSVIRSSLSSYSMLGIAKELRRFSDITERR
jgi:hypothetical protein